MGQTLRKLAALAALVALVLPGVSALAETLSAADAPSCCSSGYCPVHRRQSRNTQDSKSNCNGLGAADQNDCSMRACDAAPAPAVAITVFILVAPVSLAGPAIAKTASAAPSLFFPYRSVDPSIPPPRLFPS